MPEIMPELEDAAFCEKLVDEYENDPEKDVSYTLEDCKKEWGLLYSSRLCIRKPQIKT